MYPKFEVCTSASNHDYIAINKIETNNSFQQCPIIVTDYHYALPRLSCYMLLHLLQYLLVYKTFRYTTNVNSKRILLIIFLDSSNLVPSNPFPLSEGPKNSEHLLPQIVRHVLYPSVIKNRCSKN